MSFLQPLFLAGLLAASLPIIIHLINRRKATRRPFPALRLLRESNERIARSVKVRQWLLLALRVLAIAVLAFALAKPFVFSSEGMTADERLPTSVVFVVETGPAVHYGDWWERTVETLEDEIDGLRPWDEAALMTTSDDDPPVDELTGDHAALLDAVDDLDRRYDDGDLADRLLVADDLLVASELPNRRITVIGTGTDAPVDTHRDIRLESPVDYIGVGDADAVDNLAIVDVDYRQRGAARDGRWTIDVVVENFGTADRRNEPVELSIGDETVAATTVDVDAGTTAQTTFDHHLESPRRTEARVELSDADGLSLDNRWHFAIEPRHRARTLLVNGSPSSVPYDDELYFLTRALEPAAREGGQISPSETTPDGLDSRNLDEFDVVVLANVSSLSSDVADDLHRFVEGGGGLFVAMGNQVDINAYNQQLGDLLPRPLRGEKLLAERDDPDAPVKTTRLGHPQRQHPIFRSFDTPGSGTLQSVSVYRYMLLDPAPSDRDAEVLLSYQDNAPALLERRVGQGRVLLYTSTLDRDWTDFPVRSAYLPLINRTLLYLARRATSESDDDYIVGREIDLDVGDLVDERAIIHDPDGRRHVLEPTDGEVTFRPRLPGMYTFYADDEDDGHLVDSLAMTANIDRRVSPFDPFSHATLDEWAAADDAAEALGDDAGPTEERRINLWSYFLFFVTLALLAETVLGTRRSLLVRTVDKLAFWRQTETSDDEAHRFGPR